MKEYDKENISEKTADAVIAIVRSGEFTIERAKMEPKVLVAIFKWSNAMMIYH